MHKDTTGKPDRIVVVVALSSSTISVIEYVRQASGAYVFDQADCAKAGSVALNFTASNQTVITAFAIDGPAGTSDRVLFISMNDASQTPDTFEMVSIVLTPGAGTLTDVTCVIAEDAADRQPDDADAIALISFPLTTSTIATIFEDDGYRATITEATGTYTFTYDKVKVTAIDTSISVTGTNARNYSGIVIGSQVLLMDPNSAVSNNPAMWELSTALALVDETRPFAVGGVGNFQASIMKNLGAVTAVDGSFAVATPVGGGDGGGDDSSYEVTTFELDAIT